MRSKREGRHARIIDDVPIDSCPYPPASWNRIYWRAAWMKADKEMTALGWPHGYKAEWQKTQPQKSNHHE